MRVEEGGVIRNKAFAVSLPSNSRHRRIHRTLKRLDSLCSHACVKLPQSAPLCWLHYLLISQNGSIICSLDDFFSITWPLLLLTWLSYPSPWLFCSLRPFADVLLQFLKQFSCYYVKCSCRIELRLWSVLTWAWGASNVRFRHVHIHWYLLGIFEILRKHQYRVVSQSIAETCSIETRCICQGVLSIVGCRWGNIFLLGF